MHRQSGSLFIESLVAVLIVAMILAVTYRTVVDTSARSRQIEQRRTALLIAQSRLAMVGDAIPLGPGQVAGVEAAYAWRVVIQPRSAGLTESRAGRLSDVTVSVSPAAGGRALAVIRTVRVAGDA